MSSAVERALPLLQTLVSSKPILRKAIIEHATPDLIHAVTEIIYNMLKGVIELTPDQKRRLSRHKEEFRALVNKKLSIKKKRKILNQKGTGAGLAALIPIALTLLANRG